AGWRDKVPPARTRCRRSAEVGAGLRVLRGRLLELEQVGERAEEGDTPALVDDVVGRLGLHLRVGVRRVVADRPEEGVRHHVGALGGVDPVLTGILDRDPLLATHRDGRRVGGVRRHHVPHDGDETDDDEQRRAGAAAVTTGGANEVHGMSSASASVLSFPNRTHPSSMFDESVRFRNEGLFLAC
ncbi:MAG: hypothetical protein WAU03_03930, partial [Candidatus Saccharimonas aalborgensis]